MLNKFLTILAVLVMNVSVGLVAEANAVTISNEPTMSVGTRAGTNSDVTVIKTATNTNKTATILFVNDAGTTYDKAIEKKITEDITKTLKLRGYTCVDGKTFIKKFNQLGIGDLTTAEREDYATVFKGSNLGYSIYVEVMPITVREKSTMLSKGRIVSATVVFRIMDLKTNKYIYTDRFAERVSDSSMVGSVGNRSVTMSAINRINKQIRAILNERM